MGTFVDRKELVSEIVDQIHILLSFFHAHAEGCARQAAAIASKIHKENMLLIDLHNNCSEICLSHLPFQQVLLTLES